MVVWVQPHAPAALFPWKGSPGTHFIGGCVGPTAGLVDVKKRLLIFQNVMHAAVVSKCALLGKEPFLGYGI
jgi:hypothetical protein